MRRSLVIRISLAGCLALAVGVGPAALATSHSESTVKAVKSQETGWPVAGNENAVSTGV